MMNYSRILVPLLGILALLASVSCERGGKEAEETVEAPAVPVVVETPQVGTITEWYRTTCELRSPLETMLAFSTGGRILELAVDEGDTVSAGQFLGRVDTSVLSAQYAVAQSAAESARSQAEAAELAAQAARTQVAQAEAGFEQAEADYTRFQALYEDEVATQSEFEKVGLGYETARLSVEAARDAAAAAEAQAEAALAGVQAARDQASQVAQLIDDGTLRAPFGGRIGLRMVEPGSVVGPGTPVFKLLGEGEAVQDRFELVLDVPESVISRIGPGSTLHVKLQSCEEELIASVDRLSPEVREGSRTIEVVAYIPMDSYCLVPGMFGIARIPLEQHENAIVVPEEAVIELEDVKVVYIAEGDIAVRREVRTGIREEGRIEVTEGLTTEDQVIVIGNRFLKGGARVRIQDESGSQGVGANPAVEGDS